MTRDILDRENFDGIAQDFTKAETSWLTKDKRNYLGITLMNSGMTDVLGVLYFGSNCTDTFSDKTINRIQRFLPRIAQILNKSSQRGNK